MYVGLLQVARHAGAHPDGVGVAHVEPEVGAPAQPPCIDTRVHVRGEAGLVLVVHHVSGGVQCEHVVEPPVRPVSRVGRERGVVPNGVHRLVRPVVRHHVTEHRGFGCRHEAFGHRPAGGTRLRVGSGRGVCKRGGTAAQGGIHERVQVQEVHRIRKPVVPLLRLGRVCPLQILRPPGHLLPSHEGAGVKYGPAVCQIRVGCAEPEAGGGLLAHVRVALAYVVVGVRPAAGGGGAVRHSQKTVRGDVHALG